MILLDYSFCPLLKLFVNCNNIATQGDPAVKIKSSDVIGRVGLFLPNEGFLHFIQKFFSEGLPALTNIGSKNPGRLLPLNQKNIINQF